jgi:hypothetical protein
MPQDAAELCEDLNAELGTALLRAVCEKAKAALGDRYAAHMAELGVGLVAAAERDGKPLLQVAVESDRPEMTNTERLFILAAAVEAVMAPQAASSG